MRRDAVSRRWFLGSVFGACATRLLHAQSAPPVKKTQRILPSATVKYLDPATEFTIFRLTDPQYSAVLPSGGVRALTDRAMLYASDSSGKWEALRMDLRSHESRQLTDAESLDPQSLSFQPGGKGFWHFDGNRLVETTFSNSKARELYRVPGGFEKSSRIAYAEDGRSAVVVEKGSAGFRLQWIDLLRGTAKTVSEESEDITEPLIRPKHASATYRSGGQIWSVDFASGEKQGLALANGEISQYQWTDDGHALLYLNRPAPQKLTSIREDLPETHNDSWIANTTQFARFSANADASVFVGASGSKASPYVLLLARAVKREFTLAEHKASDPRMVAPMFTPNSQGLVFQSDRHGKPAIYWMNVEKFVAETEGG